MRQNKISANVDIKSNLGAVIHRFIRGKMSKKASVSPMAFPAERKIDPTVPEKSNYARKNEQRGRE